MTIEFPKTNLVKCEFRYTSDSDPFCDSRVANEYGERINTKFKPYIYKLVDGLEVQVGDPVVVYGTTGFQVARVVSVNATTSTMDATGLVISKVDMDAFKQHIDREKNLKEMRRVIEAKKCELEKSITYDLIAQNNPEFAALLKAFKDSGGTLC
jgi:hypothetical protein